MGVASCVLKKMMAASLQIWECIHDTWVDVAGSHSDEGARAFGAIRH
ncbi:hypothetical protein RHECNPAF_122100129 [Rhizobium etli CNPAF512]|nr:hypothetical protein RHECNPAF_122100129 [Rhizobium etli CNPAF512]